MDGLPLALEFTPGQRHEAPIAPALIGQAQGKVFVGDMAYDSEETRALLRAKKIRPVIPGNPTRKKKRRHDAETYKDRHHVENFFCDLKQNRRVATRYDKTIESYASFVYLACALMWCTAWI